MGDSELDLYLGFCERALLGEHEHEHEQRAAGEREGSGKCAHATQRNAHAVSGEADTALFCLSQNGGSSTSTFP